MSSDILDYHDLGLETGRLSHEWTLERIRSQWLISRSIPRPPVYIPDLKQRWQDETYRSYLMSALERTETEPSMLGTSPHIMVVAAKP